MPPTAQQIKDALSYGVKYYKQMVTPLMGIAPNGSPVAPIDSGISVFKHNVGPPLTGIIPVPDQGQVEAGTWQSTGPGNVGYYPLKLSGKHFFLFLNRSGQVEYEVINQQIDEETVGSVTYNFYEEVVRCTFFVGGSGAFRWNVAEYEVTYKSRWGVDLTSPDYTYKIKRNWVDAASGWATLAWGNYEYTDLADGEDKVVWSAQANQSPILADLARLFLNTLSSSKVACPCFSESSGCTSETPSC